MATISTHENVFTVGYEALADDGTKRQFQSQYAADGHVMFERRLDPLSFADRWREDRARTTREEGPPVPHGIYARVTPPGLLAFLDQSEMEDRMFLNWRVSASLAYSRVAIGTPQCLGAGREARPTISEIVHHGDYLGVAWVRTVGKTRDLLFTRARIADGTVTERAVASAVPFTTCVSAANIGREVLVVRHTAILKDGVDSDVVPYFFDIEAAI
jgi:hypothetical protein